MSIGLSNLKTIRVRVLPVFCEFMFFYVFLALLVFCSAQIQPWPTTHGNSQQTAASNATGPGPFPPSAKVLGIPCAAGPTTNVAISSGSIFFFACNAQLVSFNSSGNATRWITTPNPGYVISCIALSMTFNILYASSTVSGSGGNNYVQGINRTTGAVIWTNSLAKNDLNGAYFGCPLLTGPSPSPETVFIALTAYQGGFAAYNGLTGALRWQYRFPNGFYAWTGSNMALNLNSTVLYGGGPGYWNAPATDITLLALNTATGALLWTVLGLSPTYSKPSVCNGEIFMTTSSSMRRWSTSPTLLWSAPSAAVANGQTVCSEITSLVITASSTAVFALSPSSGAILYNVPIAGITSPLIIDSSNTLYATKASSLCAINANNGAVLWELSTLPLQTRGISMDSDGSVLVGTMSGKLILYSPQCAPGYYCSPASLPPKCCTLCSAGTFSNTTLAPSCTLCLPGTFTALAGSTSCQQCPAGHFCPSGASSWARFYCGKGNYCPEGSGAPKPCPYLVPPTGGWDALQVQGPAFLVETAHCLNHCFWNFTSGDGKLSKC